MTSQAIAPNMDQCQVSEATASVFNENLAPDAILEVKEALIRDWSRIERNEHILEMQQIWSPPDTRRLRTKMLQLYTSSKKNAKVSLGVLKSPCPSFQAELLYNKATIFYWMESATVNQGDLDGLAIVGSIWNIWTEILGRRPQFQLDDFFVMPVSVPQKVAKTIPEILQAHENICSQVRGSLEKDENRANIDPKDLRLHPICEAFLVIFDEYRFVDSAYDVQADGHRYYATVAQHQSILLVRTGKEDRLSAAINFEVLKDEALPLAIREDIGLLDGIRVPLQAGVRFVANLLLREEGGSVFGIPRISKEDCEKEGLSWAEQRLSRAVGWGRISKSMTASEVKKVLMLSSQCESDLFLFSSLPGYEENYT